MLIENYKTGMAPHPGACPHSKISQAIFVMLLAAAATLVLAGLVAWRSLNSLVSLPIL
jgi:hypothetical protein